VQARAAVSLGCPASSIVKFPWLDLSPVLDLKADREAYRARLRAREDDVVVMWNRRHEWVYSPEVYVKAASLVLKEEPRTIFAMAGQGRLTPSVRGLVESLGIEDNFRLLGWLDRGILLQYTAASDIYVTTSVSDGASASLLEAMAMELPAVASSIPGNTEWVSHRDNGLVFAKGDVVALSQEILELVRDPPERGRFGARARATVMERADWRKSSEAFLEALETIEMKR
jgi:glycosyltransferase involved in cell wall biosynthesis